MSRNLQINVDGFSLSAQVSVHTATWENWRTGPWESTAQYLSLFWMITDSKVRATVTSHAILNFHYNGSCKCSGSNFLNLEEILQYGHSNETTKSIFLKDCVLHSINSLNQEGNGLKRTKQTLRRVQSVKEFTSVYRSTSLVWYTSDKLTQCKVFALKVLLY